jgi:hypothetical protein
MDQPRPRNGCLGSIVRVIASVVLGMLVGFFVSLPINFGALERWNRWEASAPQGTVELLLEEREGLCASTSDDEVYAYNADDRRWDQTECVLAKPDSRGRAAIVGYHNPCRQEWPAFSFYANSPPEIVHCIDYSRVYMETNWTTYYALDADGQIWRWSHQLYAYGALATTLAFSLGGGVAGLVVGICWAIIWQWRNLPPDPTKQD